MSTLSTWNGRARASIKSWNAALSARLKSWDGISAISGGGGGGAVALTASDFTAYPSSPGTITWSGGQVTFANTPTTVSRLISTATKNSDKIIAQARFAFTASGSPSNDLASIMLTSDAGVAGYDTPYSAKIGSRGDTNGQYRLNAGVNWSDYNEYSSGQFQPQDVKIVYNTVDNTIKFYHWTGSAWAQMGTTQTANILNGGNIRLFLEDPLTFGSTPTPIFSDIYFISAASDYSSHYPP